MLCKQAFEKTQLPSFPVQAAGFNCDGRFLVKTRRQNCDELITKFSVLTEVQPLFWDKGTPDCCKPFVNFQSSEKIDSDSICQISHCFYGKVE